MCVPNFDIIPTKGKKKHTDVTLLLTKTFSKSLHALLPAISPASAVGLERGDILRCHISFQAFDKLGS